MNDGETYFLRTARLGFRQWCEEDLAFALKLWGDPEVTRWIDARGILSEENVRERLSQEISTEKAHGVQYWPIFLLNNDEGVGCCGLRPYDLEAKVYEIGFHICASHWGRGYAFEAAQAAVAYAFSNLGAGDLFAGHHPSNHGSRQLLGKLGFHYTHDEFYPPTGLSHPSYRFNVRDHDLSRSS